MAMTAKNFAIIPAAGPFTDLGRNRCFPKPRALLTLGEETVISRLIRQLQERGVEPIVAMGKAGEEGWTEKHVEEFLALSCKLLTTPHHEKGIWLHTIRFALEHLRDNAKNHDLADNSRILVLPGDWVMSDHALDEMLTGPILATWAYALVLSGQALSAVIELMLPAPSYACLVRFTRDQRKEELAALGFRNMAYREIWDWKEGQGKPGIVEVDYTVPAYKYSWERAKNLVARGVL